MWCNFRLPSFVKKKLMVRRAKEGRRQPDFLGSLELEITALNPFRTP